MHVSLTLRYPARFAPRRTYAKIDIGEKQYCGFMDEFDCRIEAHMQATGDNGDKAADFPPPDFMPSPEAKSHLDMVRFPQAIEAP